MDGGIERLLLIAGKPGAPFVGTHGLRCQDACLVAGAPVHLHRQRPQSNAAHPVCGRKRQRALRLWLRERQAVLGIRYFQSRGSALSRNVVAYLLATNTWNITSALPPRCSA